MLPFYNFLSKSSVTSASPVEGYADVAFFSVGANAEVNAEQLREMLDQHVLPVGLNLFDGQEHGYIEIGAIIGDQGMALRLMGLGSVLGLWQLLTPKSVLGMDNRSDQGQQMAGMGMLTIVAKDA